MRATEKIVAIMIVALSVWAVLMQVSTSFQGNGSDRILRVELGSDAASLNQAVAGNPAHNRQMVVRNTYMDFVFILLYWLTVFSLAFLAGRMGRRFLAACAGLCISVAAISDLFENGANRAVLGPHPHDESTQPRAIPPESRAAQPSRVAQRFRGDIWPRARRVALEDCSQIVTH